MCSLDLFFVRFLYFFLCLLSFTLNMNCKSTLRCRQQTEEEGKEEQILREYLYRKEYPVIHFRRERQRNSFLMGFNSYINSNPLKFSFKISEFKTVVKCIQKSKKQFHIRKQQNPFCVYSVHSFECIIHWLLLYISRLDCIYTLYLCELKIVSIV